MASLSELRLFQMPARLLAGKGVRMSLVHNRSAELWQSFRPLATQVSGRIGADFFSVQVYDSLDYFTAFRPDRDFTRWAAVAIAERSPVPAGLEILELPGGQYAVFDYRGTPAEFAAYAEQIYGRLLPQAGLRLDNRPHFEILGPAYRSNDPNAEETIYIPVC